MNDNQLWNELGNIYSNSGAFERAVQAYQKAIDADGEFGWAYHNMALAYMRLGQPEESIPYYQRSIELLNAFKDKALAWHRMGNSYQVMDDMENAILAFQRAVDLDLDNTKYRHDLAVAKAEYAYDVEEDELVMEEAVEEVVEPDEGEEAEAIAEEVVEDDDDTAIEKAEEKGGFSSWLDQKIKKLSDNAIQKKSAAFEYESIVFPEGVQPEEAIAELMAAVENQSVEEEAPVVDEAEVSDEVVEDVVEPAAEEPVEEAVEQEDVDAAADEDGDNEQAEAAREAIPPIPAAIAKDLIPSFGDVDDENINDELKNLMDELSQEIDLDEEKPKIEILEEDTDVMDVIAEDVLAEEESAEVIEEEAVDEEVVAPVALADEAEEEREVEEMIEEEAETEAEAVLEEVAADEEPEERVDDVSEALEEVEALTEEVVAGEGNGSNGKNGNGNGASASLGSAKVWSELGNIFFSEGIFDGARIAYKKAIELDDEFGLAFNNLALLHAREGEYDQAVPLYETSIKLLENQRAQAVSWNNLGNAHRALQDYEKAQEAYRKADDLDIEKITLKQAMHYGLLHEKNMA